MMAPVSGCAMIPVSQLAENAGHEVFIAKLSFAVHMIDFATFMDGLNIKPKPAWDGLHI